MAPSYAPSRDGLLLLGDLYDLLTMPHSYKMLYSSDDTVRSIAEAGLRRAVSERLRKWASNIDVACFLSGDFDLPKLSSSASYWTRDCNVALRSKNKLGCDRSGVHHLPDQTPSHSAFAPHG